MEDAGLKLKRARERLKLTYRDVAEASSVIVQRRGGNDEFGIVISRLSDIENRGIVPSIFRLYTLCAIYRLDPHDVLEWYGVNLSDLPGDAAAIGIDGTHLVGLTSNGYGEVQFPISLDPGLDIRKTTFLSRAIQRWGKLPLALLNGMDLKNHRYAFVGMEDWFMYPLLQPGALVLIDEGRRKLTSAGWSNEFERPIYFIEHRAGYLCAWLSQQGDKMIAQPHPSSGCAVQIFPADQIDIIGQVSSVAMHLDRGKRRRVPA